MTDELSCAASYACSLRMLCVLCVLRVLRVLRDVNTIGGV